MLYNVKEYHKNKIEELKTRINCLNLEEVPTVMIVYDTGSSDSNMYYKAICRDCEAIGVKTSTISPKKFIEGRSESGIKNWLDKISHYPIIHVVNGFKPGYDAYENSVFIPMRNSVEGIDRDSPYYTPACGKGLIGFLKSQKINIEGEHVTIIGRGPTMGEPLRRAFNNENATVSICNSHTDKNLIRDLCKFSKIVITAIDKPKVFGTEIINGNNSMVLVDASTCFDENGALCGSCKPELYNKVKAIGVPGGMGLLTRIGLMSNIVDFVEKHNE